MTFGNRDNRAVPGLNTASLPDLIFTVLFFFMVVTHMRKVTLKVRYRVPQGTELTRLTKKSAVSYIYIGRPGAHPATGVMQPSGECIQLNDRLATPDDIAAFMADERRRMSPDDRLQQTVSIKADRTTPVGLIAEVKQALRKARVQRISYSAEKQKKKN